MKKLVLLLAVAFSVSMFSCGGGEKQDECTDSCGACTEATEEVAPAATEEVTEEATEVTEETPAEEAPATEEAPAAE